MVSMKMDPTPSEARAIKNSTACHVCDAGKGQACLDADGERRLLHHSRVRSYRIERAGVSRREAEVLANAFEQYGDELVATVDGSRQMSVGEVMQLLHEHAASIRDRAAAG